jgi:hypothetical protein
MATDKIGFSTVSEHFELEVRLVIENMQQLWSLYRCTCAEGHCWRAALKRRDFSHSCLIHKKCADLLPATPPPQVTIRNNQLPFPVGLL